MKQKRPLQNGKQKSSSQNEPAKKKQKIENGSAAAQKKKTTTTTKTVTQKNSNNNKTTKNNGITLKLTSNEELQKKEAPLLTTYPSGVNTPGDTRLLHLEKKKNTDYQYLYGETNMMRYYSHQTFDGETIEKQAPRFALGVYDPNSKSVQVIPLHKVFRMKQKLHGSEQTEEDQGLTANDYIEMFGNARAKKAIRANERYNLQNVQRLEKEVNNARMGHRGRYPEYFPIPRTNASDVGEIYPLSDLVPEDLMEDFQNVAIDEDLLAFTQGERLNGNRLSKIPYVIQELVESNPDYFRGEEGSDLTKTALYLSYLIWLYKTPHRFSNSVLKAVFENDPTKISPEFKKITILVPPKKIINHLVTHFCTRLSSTTVSRTKENNDKLLAHILLMYAHVRNYTLRFDCLQKDLMTPAEMIETVAKLLGFEQEKPNEETRTVTWSLKLRKRSSRRDYGKKKSKPDEEEEEQRGEEENSEE